MRSMGNAMAEQDLHLVVVGAGALGTLVGASVWLGGRTQVTLVGNESNVRAINANGVRIIEHDRADRIAQGSSLRAVTRLDQVGGTIDYLLVTVKAPDMPVVLKELAPFHDRASCAFSFQNGVDHDEQLAQVLGRETVVGAMTMEGAAMPAPGVIDHLLASTTYVGEFSGKRTLRISRLAALLGRSGFRTQIVDDIRTAQWTKFVQSCASSAVCGATRLGYAPATQTPHGALLYVNLLTEGVAVMRAQGMEPGHYFTDAARVRDLANKPTTKAIEIVRTIAQELIERGYIGNTSLARDLEAGKRSEVDSIIGSMVQMGARYGVATPTIRAMYWAIKAVDEASHSQRETHSSAQPLERKTRPAKTESHPGSSATPDTRDGL